MADPLSDRGFPAAKRFGGEALPRVREPHADPRLPLPPAARADRRGPPLRQPDGDLARRRPLQVAGDAGQRRARAVLHRRRLATGRSSQKWAETVPKTLRNPLYHWTHLELKRPFGIADRLLGPGDGRAASGTSATRGLPQPEFSCRGIMRQMNVVLVCTTDDPVDTLEHHQRRSPQTAPFADPGPAGVPARQGAWPSRSPAAFNAWVDRLAAAAGRGDPRLSTTLVEALAPAARLLPRRGLPPLRPRPRDGLRRGLHRSRDPRRSSRRLRAGKAASTRRSR